MFIPDAEGIVKVESLTHCQLEYKMYVSQEIIW